MKNPLLLPGKSIIDSYFFPLSVQLFCSRYFNRDEFKLDIRVPNPAFYLNSTERPALTVISATNEASEIENISNSEASKKGNIGNGDANECCFLSQDAIFSSSAYKQTDIAHDQTITKYLIAR
jgi:hypothetical protein